ncbi:hypothetical protein JOC34_000982 [Virgibacillus halotolerans]|nr:hypothetical protein [Virgibacillus halotolerans]
MTPAGTARVRRPRRAGDEGRLKTAFAANVVIPLVGARRLRPCPRKATIRSGKQPALMSRFRFVSKTTILGENTNLKGDMGYELYEKIQRQI